LNRYWGTYEISGTSPTGFADNIELTDPSAEDLQGALNFETFVASGAIPILAFGGDTHTEGDFIYDSSGKRVGVAPPEALGIQPTNIEFVIVGGIMRPPSLFAGSYKSGGGGINLNDFPFRGNRIGLDYHAWKQTAGEMLLHLDVKIQQLGINLRHWRPW
jgi:hypothetical protein